MEGVLLFLMRKQCVQTIHFTALLVGIIVGLKVTTCLELGILNKETDLIDVD